MTNVDEPRFPGFDAPVDQIGISAGWQHTQLLYACSSTRMRELPDQFDCLADDALDVARALRAPLIQVVQNCNKVIPRARRKANPHSPWRFQRASISASGTNSPRL